MAMPAAPDLLPGCGLLFLRDYEVHSGRGTSIASKIAKPGSALRQERHAESFFKAAVS
jgi:hypothetical protein